MANSNNPAVIRQRPLTFDAMQYRDANSYEIWVWAEGLVYFVARGYEHPLRTANEKERGNGHVRDDAQSFLVVMTADGTLVRAGWGDWIVKTETGLGVIPHERFENEYEVVAGGAA